MTVNSLMVSAQLPWDSTPEDARRTRRINAVALLLGFLAFIIIPQLKLPKPPRGAEVIPERIARVIQEKKIELPPPPPLKREEKKEVKTDKAIEKTVETEHVATVKPIIDKSANKPSETEVKNARAKAGKAMQDAGIADALSDLRDFDTVATTKNPSTGGGLQKDSGAPVGTSRNMISSKAGTGSGGVAYAGASSGYGGGVAGGKGGKGDFNLGARGTKDMKGGLIAGGGGGGVAGGRGDGSGGGGGAGGIGKRTTEDIRRIFDQNGGRLNNAYQRALKDDPSMEGTVRLKLVVDPSGKVISCEIASSALNNPELEAKILSIVKGFNFGEDNVDVWKGTYPVNFYPN